MRAASLLATLASSFMCGIAAAQDFAEPVFHVWQPHPVQALPASRLKAMVRVDAVARHNTPVIPDGHGQTPDPVLLARQVAAEILQRLPTYTANDTCAFHWVEPLPLASRRDLVPGEVCMSFFSYGRDLADCDLDYDTDGTNPDDDSTGAFHYSMLRFFMEEDRWPGIADDDSLGPVSFPTNDDPDDPDGTGPIQSDNDREPANYASNRAYRHPFLINAGDPGINPTHAPLRQDSDGNPHPDGPVYSKLKWWTYQFVKTYRELELARGPEDTDHAYHDLPPIDLLTLDVEEVMCFPEGVNPVWFLRQIASESNYTEWYNRPVPGHGGQTLAQLYERDYRKFGLPAPLPVIPNAPLPEPVILDGSIGLSWNPSNPVATSNQAQFPRNRPFLLWWDGICLTSSAAVLEFSAFREFRRFYPTIRCGNYDDMRMDQQVDTTSWFMDWTSPFTLSTLGERVAGNAYPRSLIYGNDGRLMHGTHGNFDYAGFPKSHRWLARGPASLGQLDQPVCYLMPEEAYDGTYTDSGGVIQHPGWAQGAGHQQPNQYLPVSPGGTPCGTSIHPCETLLQTTMRLGRHAAESIINSRFDNDATNPGDPFTGGHEDRLDPWIEMAWAPTNVLPGPRFHLMLDQDLAEIIAMYRAMNIRRATCHTGINFGDNGQGGPIDPTAHVVWAGTSQVIDRVYGPRIHDASVSYGMWPNSIGPGGTLIPEPIPTSTLEFTLRAAGQPKTVNILSNPPYEVVNGVLQPLQTSGTVMNVSFNIPEEFRDYPQFTIKLEGAAQCRDDASGADPQGIVYALGTMTTSPQDPPRWYAVPLAEREPASFPDNDVAHHLWAPGVQVSNSNPPAFQRAFRRSFHLKQSGSLRFVDTEGRLHLKLNMKSRVEFSSHYDLVQVIPVPPADQHPLGPLFPTGTLVPQLSSPVHANDWNALAPRPLPSDGAQLTSEFNNGTKAAIVTFRGSIRTNAPKGVTDPEVVTARVDCGGCGGALRPVQVYYWISADSESFWANVTDDVEVILPHEGEPEFSNRIEIRAVEDKNFPPGFYAAVVNNVPYDPPSQPQFTVYCDELPDLGPLPLINNMEGLVQYNFTIFGDCENNATHAIGFDGLIDESDFPCWHAAHTGYCPADLASGSGPTPDGAVDINDLLFFLQAFESGHAAADINADAAVDVNDLLEFLQAFEDGC